jgi:hypothetical protein
MTIKQQGGVFGRNPTFNDVTVQSLAVSDLDAFRVPVTGADGLLSTSSTLVWNGSSLRFPLGVVQTNNNPQIMFNKDDGVTRAKIYYDTTNGATVISSVVNSEIRFDINDTEVAQINQSGNLVFKNSGQGIDFSATAGTGTSELFDDYEEGTFTATLTPNTSGTITPDSFDTLAYTKVGRQVTITGQVGVASVASPVGTYFDLNLPFAIGGLTDLAERSSGAAFDVNNSVLLPMRTVSGSAIRVYVDCSTIATGRAFVFSFTYFTD